MSKNRNLLLSLLKKKGFKEERMTKVGVCAIDKATTLESNKSLSGYRQVGLAIMPGSEPA